MQYFDFNRQEVHRLGNQDWFAEQVYGETKKSLSAYKLLLRSNAFLQMELPEVVFL